MADAHSEFHVTFIGTQWESGRKSATEREVTFFVTGIRFKDDGRIKSVGYSADANKAARLSHRCAEKVFRAYSRRNGVAIVAAG